MTVKVTVNDLRTAALWLESYEGEGDAAEVSCARVAAMLLREVREREIESGVRKLMRETGCRPEQARARLREVFAPNPPKGQVVSRGVKLPFVPVANKVAK